ncbi:MAG: type II secretion system F family protein [Campylobacteraceae bacterium]|nr:type II secretion system F family protein [Campylobacteraceae bacterium]
MIFKYSGIDGFGNKVNSKIEALSLDDAKRRLKSQNIIYKSLKEDSFTFLNRFTLKRKHKISSGELAVFSRDISIYLKSGISLVDAVALSSNQYAKNKKMQLFLRSIKTALDEGKNFYFALENQNVIALPNFYKQSIKVSEDSGILTEILLELSRFLKEQERLEKQVQNAFAYPIFILIVSCFMVGFIVTYIVPKISSIFEQMNQELPKITQIVIAFGNWMSNNWLYLAAGIFLFALLFRFILKTSSKIRYRFDFLMLKLPFFGKIIQSSELGRFTYVASVLVRSGVPFVKTVRLSSSILKNSVIAAVFEKASLKVVEGSRLSAALLKSGFELDNSFVQAITLGEETSEVSMVLHNMSELYFEENRDKIALFLSLLEPALMLIVGGIIGLIVTSMLLPIFSINIS